MPVNTSTFGQLDDGAPLVNSDILAIQRIDGFNYRITAADFATFIGAIAGITSINGDITAAQVIAAGTGLGLVDAGATHTLSIDATVATLTGAQTLTNKIIANFSNFVLADGQHIQVRNESGGALAKGDVVHQSGFSIGQSLPLVIKADADVATDMPALGLVNEAIANNASGQVCITGRMDALNTGAFTAGDILYVSTTAGEFTNVKPTGTAEIQNIATVLRSHASLGEINIISLSRSNDLPNIPAGQIWIGDASAVPTGRTMSGNATISNTGVLSIANDAITTVRIINDAVTLAKLASGTAGNLITYDASGNPAAVATGTSGQVLTSNGVGTAPTFQALPSSGILTINGDGTAAQVIAGTLNRITVGDVAATHTIDIAATYVGQASIVTLGTITTGVWNGTAITGANINAASTDLTDSAVIVRTNQINTFGNFVQTFKDNALHIENPAGTFDVVFQTSAEITLDRILTIPLLGGNRTMVVTGLASQIALGTEVTGASTNLTDSAALARNTDNLGFFAATTSLQLLGVISDETGTGLLVFGTSPTLITPALGTPSALVGTNITGTAAGLTAGNVTTNANLTGDVTSVGNATTITALDATKIADGTVTSAEFQFLNTVSSNIQTQINTKGDAETADPLSQFAATTSAQLAGVISNETGSGLLVFGTSPTIVTPTIASFASATHNHSDAAGGGNLTNTALTSGTFAAITGLGTLSVALVMGTNLITGIKGTQFVQEIVTYNATQVFDLNDNQYQQITLTGVLSTLTTSNRAGGKMKSVIIVGDSVDRVLTFNTSWKTNPSDATVTVVANTFGVLSLYCRGTAETDVFAVYAEFS